MSQNYVETINPLFQIPKAHVWELEAFEVSKVRKAKFLRLGYWHYPLSVFVYQSDRQIQFDWNSMRTSVLCDTDWLLKIPHFEKDPSAYQD